MSHEIYLLNQKIETLENLVSAQNEAIKNIFESINSMNDYIQSSNILNEHLTNNVNRISGDLNFSILILYWFFHVAERIDKFIPLGTLDVVMNSVEESFDINTSTFYNLFNELREADADE